jgi:hypothetical protein
MIQRLNLVPPDPERSAAGSGSPASAASTVTGCVLPEANPEAVKEVARRAKQMIESGVSPDSVYLCKVQQGTLTFQYDRAQKPALLLFTTPWAAVDYLRAAEVTGTVGGIKCDVLPGYAQGWTKGADNFVLNRCPRCNIMLLNQIHVLQDKESFRKMWAVVQAGKIFRAQVQIQAAGRLMAKPETLGQARAALEMVRDHIDCGVPYLHQLMALLAGTQQDAAAKTEAINRLNEFGTQFAGKGEFSPENLAEATVGLYAAYGMLNGQAAASRPPGS